MGMEQETRRGMLIIDTDPGIDDSMTILMAFQEPSVQIIGLTTVFGNVSQRGGCNSRRAIAGRPEIAVAEDSAQPLKGGKPSVFDFVTALMALAICFFLHPLLITRLRKMLRVPGE